MNRFAPLSLTAALPLTLAVGLAHAAPDKVFMNDYTGDGVVDAADYTVWRDSLGDFNGDHQVDASDLNDWRANFGQTSSAGSPGPSVDDFNGWGLAKPVAGDAELAWYSVPLRGLFPTGSAYEAWLFPMTSAASVAGDYDGDGLVDAADYTIWRVSLSNQATLAKFLAVAGDHNADGDVDGRDFLIWQRGLGSAANANPSTGASPDFDEDGDADEADHGVWKTTNFLTLDPNAANDPLWLIAPCPGDLNGDGVLDNGDIGAFVNLFLASDPAADFNGDGLLDNGDIGAFVAAFLAGC